MRDDRRKVERPVVAISGAAFEGDSLEEALNRLPVEEVIFPGETVVITPNLVKSLPPESGTVVGPETLRKLLRLVKSHRPERLVVACGSGGDPTTKVLEEQGYALILEEERVDFIDLNYGPYVELKLDHPYPSRIEVNQLYSEADVLISFTQLKHHQEATMSAGLKNITLSWPPAEIHGFPKTQRGIHEDLHEFIAAMAKVFPIDLSIVSCDQAMVGTGPSGGKPVNADLVIAGTDPVAVDVVAARLLGFMPQAVAYLYRIIKAGIGEGDLKKIDLRGIPLDQAEELFSRAAYDHVIAIDAGRLKPLQLK